MLGGRHIPNHLESLNYEENLTKHYRKLEEIQKEDRKKRNLDKEVAGKTKFTESREKTIKFHINERTNAIEKDNELLLGRLVEISRKKPNVLALVKSEANLPKTLNGPSRRREKNRIAAENEAFARRLLSQQPSFNPKKLEMDYEKHNQRVKNMAKITHFSPRKIRLPPIKYVEADKNTKKGKKDQKRKTNENEIHVKEVSQVRSEGNEEVEVKPSQIKHEQVKTEENKSVSTRNHEAEQAEAREKEAKEKEAREKEAKEKEVVGELAKENATVHEDKPQENHQSQPLSAVQQDNKSQVLTESQPPQVQDKHDQPTEHKPAAAENHAVPNSETVTEQKPAPANETTTENKPVATSGTNLENKPASNSEIVTEQKPADNTHVEQNPEAASAN